MYLCDSLYLSLRPLQPNNRRPTRQSRQRCPNRHRPSPHLRPRIITAGLTDDRSRGRRSRERREPANRPRHAKPRPHLPRVPGQRRQRAREDALRAPRRDAVEDGEDVHARARVGADPAVGDDAEGEERAHVDVEGADVLVAQVPDEGSDGDGHAVGDEEDADGFDGREADDVSGITIDLLFLG